MALIHPIFHTGEYIKSDRFLVDFENIILTDSLISINQKSITFNVNVKNNKVLIFDEVNNIIENKKKLNISISCVSHTGEVLVVIFLINVNFLKIKNFINFDYSYNTSDIIKLKVKYKCEKQKIFSTFEKLKIYQRKQKLEFLNKLI